MVEPKSFASSELSASYAWCAAVCRASNSSFLSSFRLLDRPRRTAMHALYAFARITDDLGDSPRLAGDRRQLLGDWKQATGELLQGDSRFASEKQLAASASLEQYALLWPALLDSLQRFDIPPDLLLDVVEGVSMDIDHQPPRDWAELNQYCYHVASAIGLACTYIWRCDALPSRQASVDCGIAFQLTNVLRDVAEDANNGRIYLPLSELERFGIDPERWLAGNPDGDWLGAIESVSAEALRLYDSGWSVIGSLTPRSQRMFSLMWHSYRQLLVHVLHQKRSLFAGPKPKLSRTAKLKLLTRHLMPNSTWPFGARPKY